MLYRMMASINVRSLAGFNQRVREAKAKPKPVAKGKPAAALLGPSDHRRFDAEYYARHYLDEATAVSSAEETLTLARFAVARSPG